MNILVSEELCGVVCSKGSGTVVLKYNAVHLMPELKQKKKKKCFHI